MVVRSCRTSVSGIAVALEPGMDKEQDADLEKGYGDIEDAMYFDDDERLAFEHDDDDLFDERVSGDELDYEPEGAFLD